MTFLMKKLLCRQSALILISLLCAVMAAWTGSRYLKHKADQLEAQVNGGLVQRVVALYDLPAGTIIEAGHLAFKEFPVDSVSSDSLHPTAYEHLEGRRSEERRE